MKTKLPGQAPFRSKANFTARMLWSLCITLLYFSSALYAGTNGAHKTRGGANAGKMPGVATLAASSNAGLASMGPQYGPLSPVFNTSITSYTLNVSNATATMWVKPVTSDATATIKVNGTSVSSGTMSTPVPLAEGAATNINVVVTAQDGTTTKTYTIAVTRAPPANATLSSMGPQFGPLSPVFSSNVTSYSLHLAYSSNTATMTVKPAATDVNATIKVNGTVVQSGTTSPQIQLAAGATTAINVVVTSSDGTATKTYTINVTRDPSNQAFLSNLQLSNVVLNPQFSTNRGSYTATVANAVSSTTVTPTVSDLNASIKVNGVSVVSGTASGAIALAAGATTTITVIVTAQDGATTDTYTIAVTRASPAGGSDATLSAIGPQYGPLSPAFSSSVTSYSLHVGYSSPTLTVAPVATDVNATIKVNGTVVKSGATSPQIQLAAGATTAINIVVTSSDGTATKTYTINVTRDPSNQASLSNLQLSNVVLSPQFSTNRDSYTSTVSNAVSSTTVTPTVSDPNASVKVNGVSVVSGTASGAIALAAGATTTITVIVTAQDGTTTATYTIAVTRASPAGGSDATLSALGPQYGPLSPAFSSSVTSYSLHVGYSSPTITVAPVATDVNATIKVNGTVVKSGATSPQIQLAEGATTAVNVVVTSSDGTATKTYTINVSRDPSSDASLSSLQLSNVVLPPTLSNNSTATVNNDVSTTTVTPTVSDPNASVTVNGTPVVSGTASGSIALAAGATTTITVIVTAQDGETTGTYTVAITRTLTNGNVTLQAIGSQFTPLSPVFSATVTSYSLHVANAHATMTVAPVATDANSIIKVNGTVVSSGATSPHIPLTAGGTTAINIVVTSSDGTATKTYTINVSRDPSDDASHSNLQLSNIVLSPQFSSGKGSYTSAVSNSVSTTTVPRAPGSANGFDPVSMSEPVNTVTLAGDGIKVHQGISPNGDGIEDFLQIDNISQYPDNKLTIMNRSGLLVYEAKGYDNSSKLFDGHSNKNGQMQLPGTYFYQLDYTVSGITRHKTGFIVLKY